MQDKERLEMLEKLQGLTTEIGVVMYCDTKPLCSDCPNKELCNAFCSLEVIIEEEIAMLKDTMFYATVAKMQS